MKEKTVSMIERASQEVLMAFSTSLPLLALTGTIFAGILGFLISRAYQRRLLARRARQTMMIQRRYEARAVASDSTAAAPDGGLDTSRPKSNLRVLFRKREHLPVFVLGGFALSFITWIIIHSSGFDSILSAILAVIMGILAPLSLRSYLRARWLKRFAREFPAALDQIIRGLRAGLPMMECVALVASESRPEVANVFRTVLNDYAIGMPIDKALKRMAEKIPLEEVRFFTIVIGLQSQTGGGLADMLDTLAETLRKRRELVDKVQIMSQEARSSATIIGSLPILVAGLLFVVSPEYVSMLFTTKPGLIAITGAGLWMLLGVQIMRSMISFDS
ncbi:type II secretion system F family protein [Roseibaca sp. Y0-43]|uniref:type II secretion system F family protein n=1 Tax=Roseibaca sp. Y0-43 TaxID=2816854 RepID=UPI001D0C2F66|nr:type II secretion system F family protein [Roseibaca sp. Y0-43]MCC1482891.1 type II secretion system F family protein [Roseibaca sp. Y0-43]